MNSLTRFAFYPTRNQFQRIFSLGISLALFASSADLATGAPDAFTTLAGDPLWAGSADGTGSAAKFYFPTGVAVDVTGFVYVADTVNQTVRRETSSATMNSDFDGNGNGTPDLIWQNIVTGGRCLWMMEGPARIGVVDLGADPDINWRISN